jgi:hypothetical protein
MRYIVPAALLIVALIHALPLVGVLGAAKLSSLYGIPVQEPNLEILLRHRAVLFGLLAVFLAYAAFHPALHGIALAAGVFSVVSFLLLAWSVGGANSSVTNVVRVDWAALLVLLPAGAAHLLHPANG